LARLKNGLLEGVKKIEDIRNSIQDSDNNERTSELTEQALSLLEDLRGTCDAAESRISGEYWPYPRYRELLLIR
ncbi:MAG: glutamine synthetase type III, partial [Synergistota bacterium]|nr:glutamine synthetase type III [Synergistota bacterium]